MSGAGISLFYDGGRVDSEPEAGDFMPREKGNSYPLAVADVVESMASHRPYRPARGIDPALEEIEKNRGTLYDNTVADACLRLFREKGFKL